MPEAASSLPHTSSSLVAELGTGTILILFSDIICNFNKSSRFAKPHHVFTIFFHAGDRILKSATIFLAYTPENYSKLCYCISFETARVLCHKLTKFQTAHCNITCVCECRTSLQSSVHNTAHLAVK